MYTPGTKGNGAMTRLQNPNNVDGRQDDASEQPRSILQRTWERIQYPGGPESRQRLMASRESRRYGW
jgi:hypothetical protein